MIYNIVGIAQGRFMYKKKAEMISLLTIVL